MAAAIASPGKTPLPLATNQDLDCPFVDGNRKARHTHARSYSRKGRELAFSGSAPGRPVISRVKSRTSSSTLPTFSVSRRRTWRFFKTPPTARRQWLDTFDSIDDLILVHSVDGTILRANRALANRLGVELGALVGNSVRDVLHSSGLPWSRCPYCEGVAGKADEVDPSFGGYFLASDSSLHDSEGGHLGTIHVLKDFTDRRQAENKFRNLFEKVQEGIFISAPDGRFLDFNDAFMRILGYESHDELLQADIPCAVVCQPSRS